jgi:tRNA(Ile2) C34 agmatinyltransferase TiaS
MTCEPFCDLCGGNLGHPANGDWTCAKCKEDLELRRTEKKRITKAEFERNFRNDPRLFRLRTRGGGYRYYRRVA